MDARWERQEPDDVASDEELPEPLVTGVVLVASLDEVSVGSLVAVDVGSVVAVDVGSVVAVDVGSLVAVDVGSLVAVVAASASSAELSFQTAIPATAAIATPAAPTAAVRTLAPRMPLSRMFIGLPLVDRRVQDTSTIRRRPFALLGGSDAFTKRLRAL